MPRARGFARARTSRGAGLAGLAGLAAIAGGAIAAGGALAACVDADGLDIALPGVADATTSFRDGAPASRADAAAADAGAGCDAAADADLQSDPAHCGACGRACAAPADPTQTAACLAGSCGFACAAGLADCDVDASNGCEVTLATSSANCGACGHVCATGACSAGACPFTTLVADAGTLGRIAIDSTNLYVAESSPSPGIYSLPTAGGVLVPLTATSAPADLQVAPAGDLDFSDVAAGTIDALPAAVDAGAPVALVGGLTMPREIRFGSSSIFWSAETATPGNWGIFTIVAAAGPVTATRVALVTGAYAQFFAATPTFLFYADQAWLQSPTADPSTATLATLTRCSAPTCASPAPLARGYRIYDVAADAENVFWTTWGTSSTGGTLSFCALASACLSPTTLTGLSQPTRIVSSGSTVYWVESGLGEIRALSLPADGGTVGAPRTVAAGVSGVSDLVLDSMYIYWVQTARGEIDRAER